MQAQLELTLADGKQQICRLEIVDSRNSATYVKHKKNCNQVVWLCRKQVSDLGDDVVESTRRYYLPPSCSHPVTDTSCALAASRPT